MRWICTLAAIVAFVAGGSRTAEALQPQYRPYPCKPGLPDSSRGILRGQLLDDSTGKPLTWGVALLIKADCRAVALGDGRFEFAGIPLGDDSLEVITGPYKRRTPLPVTIRRSDPQELVIRVKRGNRVADCREIEPCNALLTHNSAADSLDDSERLQEAALRLNVALVVAQGQRLGDFAICLQESNARVRSALMAVVPRVVGGEECAHTETRRGRPSGLFTHAPTGMRAVKLSSKTLRRDDTRATVELSDFGGPGLGIGWDCELVSTGGRWTPVACEITWIT